MFIMKFAAKIKTESLITKPVGLKTMEGFGKNLR
jgi:hypothetical protein